MAGDRAAYEPESGGGVADAALPLAPAGPRCRRCGYELRGLPTGGECPECGLSVQRSLRGNLLEYSDPAYLRRVRTGAGLVVLSVVMLGAMPLGALGWVIVMAAADLGESFIRLGAAVGALACIGAGVLGLVGLFLLTSRDPGFAGRDESDRSRLVTRIATAITALGWGAGAVVSASPAIATTAPVLFATAGLVLGFVLLIAVSVQLLASVYYMQHLAARMPSPGLRGHLASIRVQGFAMAICGVLVFALVFTPLAACAGTVGGLLSLVLTLAFLINYADAADRLRREVSRLASSGG